MAKAPRADKSRWAEVPESWQQELSDETLLDCAGKTIFARGVEYFEQGLVTLARDGGGNATFEVEGTQTYSTEVYFEDVGLHVDCTCPHAQNGDFCKHMVAAALLWRRHLGGEAAAPPRKARTATAEKAAQTKARKRDDLNPSSKRRAWPRLQNVCGPGPSATAS
jgi:uncharacterized Zn finger protein